MIPAGPDRRIFVDTSAYYAAADQRDASFAAVSSVIRRLVLARYRLITTNFILAELHALVLARGSATAAISVVQRIKESPATTIVRARSRDEERAWEILLQYDDKDFSYTDALSFAVMGRLDLHQALSLDQHFAQYGLILLPLDQ